MNSVHLIGNLTRDPERRGFPDGGSMAEISIAVPSPAKDADGNYKTDFFDISVYGSAAENCMRYLMKGKKVCIDGYLRHDRWTDSSGKNRTILRICTNKVEFLSPRGSGAAQSTEVTVDTLEDVTTDDIPFD